MEFSITYIKKRMKRLTAAIKMQVLAFQRPLVSATSGQRNKKRIPLVSPLISSLPFSPLSLTGTSAPSLPSRCRIGSKLNFGSRMVKANALNVGTGSGGYEESHGNNNQSSSLGEQHSDASLKSDSARSPNQFPYPFSVVLVLGACACALAFLPVLFSKGPSSLLPALAKSGFTAAFSLIFVSEIGDKTFFIAALLAMQYDKLLVLLGSMAALSLMTILSVVIGVIFHSVPSQFQTTLPIGEYAAVTLLMFFGLKSIKDAWDLPSSAAKDGDKPNLESDEFAEAEELVKEKVSKRLTNPLEVIWKSFSLVFFAEWGDRSMLATIALGAAQSALGVASGAIVGHLVATAIAILGGAFLAHYISEKLVGYIGGGLFLVFAIATFFGVF